MAGRICFCALAGSLVAMLGCEAVAGIEDRTLGSSGAAGLGAAGTGAGTSAGGSGAGGSTSTGGGGATPGGPTLLISVEHFSDAQGEYLLCPLGGSSPLPCESHTPAGLPAQPFSIGWIPPDLLVAATWGEVYAIDRVTNALLWAQTGDDFSQMYPFDIFPIATPDGGDLAVAVAFGTDPSSEVRNIVVFNRVGTQLHHWTLNADGFPLGLSWTGMTEQPDAPLHFFAVNGSSGIARREVDPYAPANVGQDMDNSPSLTTIYALKDDTGARIAWTGGINSPWVYYLSGQATVAGPSTCKLSSYDDACMPIHAVPDPTAPDRYVALCDHPTLASVERQVVRFTVPNGGTDGCDVIYDSLQFGQTKRLSRLAVMQ